MQVLPALLIFVVCLLPVQETSDKLAASLEAIKQQHYSAAINLLEDYLAAHPNNPEALSNLATAHLYAERDYLKAQKLLEEAVQAGGRATFWVSHSHETLGTNDLADYCRGWLHLRKEGVEFVPEEPAHAFRARYSELKDFKQNRMLRTLFHIQIDKKTYNFRPRTADEREVWLILALYKKFAR